MAARSSMMMTFVRFSVPTCIDRLTPCLRVRLNYQIYQYAAALLLVQFDAVEHHEHLGALNSIDEFHQLEVIRRETGPHDDLLYSRKAGVFSLVLSVFQLDVVGGSKLPNLVRNLRALVSHPALQNDVRIFVGPFELLRHADQWLRLASLLLPLRAKPIVLSLALLGRATPLSEQ